MTGFLWFLWVFFILVVCVVVYIIWNILNNFVDKLYNIQVKNPFIFFADFGKTPLFMDFLFLVLFSFMCGAVIVGIIETTRYLF